MRRRQRRAIYRRRRRGTKQGSEERQADRAARIIGKWFRPLMQAEVDLRKASRAARFDMEISGGLTQAAQAVDNAVEKMTDAAAELEDYMEGDEDDW